jgi:hypothetical protein
MKRAGADAKFDTLAQEYCATDAPKAHYAHGHDRPTAADATSGRQSTNR